MDIPIISVENSKGIPLSKKLLKRGNIGGNYKIYSGNSWAKLFTKTAKRQDKKLNSFDIFDDEKINSWSKNLY